MSDTAKRMGTPLRLLLAAIAILGLVLPLLVVLNAPPAPPRPRLAQLPPPRVVPRTVVPEVEPVELVKLAPKDAQEYNADIPFSREPNPAARPFRSRDGAEDLARATDCLAAAVLYEAGNDREGQRAVAQVVLNRLRHPAFPKSICGVVFEGQERSTGCQFTFTCDGALTRWRPSESMWKRARDTAAAALKGSVYKPVGYATHYHTNWVVPYWQSSLEKITEVGDHLFFRWSGWWGTPPAFNRQVQSTEPAIARLAAFSDSHRLGDAVAEADEAMLTALLVTGQMAADSTVQSPSDPDTFLAVLPRGAPSDSFPAVALRTCGDRPKCKYLAWTDARIAPKREPLGPAQLEAMTFSYLRDQSTGFEKALWNCGQVERAAPFDCMRRDTLTAIPVPAGRQRPASKAPDGPTQLEGVRRAPRAAVNAPRLDPALDAVRAPPGLRATPPGAEPARRPETTP